MRNILLLIAICFGMKSFGQSIKEIVINDIYKTFVDTSYSSYYLHETCLTIKHLTRYSQQLEKFNGIIPDTTLTELLIKSSVDTLPQKWNCNVIKKSKCITDSTNNGILIIQLVNYHSKSFRRKIEKENKIINRKPEQERSLYYFSRPIIDNKNKFAIIEMTCAYGSSYYDMYFSCIYLLRNTNGQWRKIAETACFSGI